MDPHYWADWAIIAQAVLAIIAGILVYFQIWSSQQESRKWKTLDICAQHELSERLASAAAELREFFNADPRPDIKTISSKWKTILNYLDGIAIGVEQGLYIEDLAKDHLKQIVEHHVREAFENPGYLVKNKGDYLKLCDMREKWIRDKSYYKTYKVRFGKLLLHPWTVLIILSTAIVVIAILAIRHVSSSSG
jgi:hypothetical protein